MRITLKFNVVGPFMYQCSLENGRPFRDSHRHGGGLRIVHSTLSQTIIRFTGRRQQSLLAAKTRVNCTVCQSQQQKPGLRSVNDQPRRGLIAGKRSEIPANGKQ
jgi:hypothetical protein